jgi:hypothetical protein
MQRRLAAVVPLGIATTVYAGDDTVTEKTTASRWSAERANQWYAAQDWPCGFNCIPANAISYTEMWMPYCFEAESIDNELVLAEEVGFNCLRVVLPFVVGEHDPEAFKLPRATRCEAGDYPQRHEKEN